MALLKIHNIDELIKYLLKILELFEKPFLDKNELKKLVNLFTKAEIGDENYVFYASGKMELPPA